MGKILSEGMRVKVEGKPRGRNLFEAQKVVLKGDATGTLSVEGILEEIDLDAEQLNIGGVTLLLDSLSGVIGMDGSIESVLVLKEGMRINAEYLKNGNNRIRATKIRILDSRDRDVEIKALVDQLIVHGRFRMDILVLNKRFQCDKNTHFITPSGEQIDVDFSKLDVYRRLVDTDEERPPSQLSLGDILTIGGEVQVDLIPESNFDLDDGINNDELLFSKLSTRLELSSKPHPEIDLFFKMAAREPLSSFDPLHPDRSVGEIRLAESYILWRKVLTRRLGLKFGRQDYDEKREWLYDENLDAIRLYLNYEPVVVELSASTNFSETKERDKGVVNYIVYGTYDMGNERQIAAYVIHREDDDRLINYDRRWYGIRSFGDVGKTFEYWIELSQLVGEKRGRELRSKALDVGFTTTFKKALLEPSVTLGYAYGSGDDDFRDGVDGNFRQTDFEDNNDKFNGVNSFRYYGEVLDPELSNMHIFTYGLGFRWSRNGSFDIMYHNYRQVVADNDVHGSNLLIDPAGANRDVGDEVDFILGLEKLKNIDVKLTVGFFMPGSAFRPSTDTASRTKLQIEYNF